MPYTWEKENALYLLTSILKLHLCNASSSVLYLNLTSDNFEASNYVFIYSQHFLNSSQETCISEGKIYCIGFIVLAQVCIYRTKKNWAMTRKNKKEMLCTNSCCQERIVTEIFQISLGNHFCNSNYVFQNEVSCTIMIGVSLYLQMFQHMTPNYILCIQPNILYE